jgi:hypothetical protein
LLFAACLRTGRRVWMALARAGAGVLARPPWRVNDGRRRWGRRGAPTCGARRPSGWSLDQGRRRGIRLRDAPLGHVGSRCLGQHTLLALPLSRFWQHCLMVSLLSSTATCWLYHTLEWILFALKFCYPVLNGKQANSD